jgi:hypothetical protein
MIWVAGRSPTLVSQNLKATTLTYLAITIQKNMPLECPRRRLFLVGRVDLYLEWGIRCCRGF